MSFVILNGSRASPRAFWSQKRREKKKKGLTNRQLDKWQSSLSILDDELHARGIVIHRVILDSDFLEGIYVCMYIAVCIVVRNNGRKKLSRSEAKKVQRKWSHVTRGRGQTLYSRFPSHCRWKRSGQAHSCISLSVTKFAYSRFLAAKPSAPFLDSHPFLARIYERNEWMKLEE